MDLYHYMRPVLGQDSVMLSPEQKKLLGIRPTGTVYMNKMRDRSDFCTLSATAVCSNLKSINTCKCLLSAFVRNKCVHRVYFCSSVDMK